MILSRAAALAALLLAGLARPALADGSPDALLALAERSGCMSCHTIDPGGKGPDGLAPIGPPWREVAARYRGQADAVAQLTQTVVAGSNPYQSHWAGKVSGVAMPPNAVAIKEAEARQLVKWILSLDAAKAR
jgi:cytochrome c